MGSLYEVKSGEGIDPIKLTTAERTALTPSNGLIVYDTTLNKLFVYDGTSWADTTGGGGGVLTPTINSTTIVEVSQASHLPATLAANTTYIVRGSITLSTAISVTNVGCSIIGFDRNKDKLIWDGATGTTMLTVTDVDFDLEGLCLSSNNTGAVLIEADNYNILSYNQGRLNVLTITHCQFRNCFDIASIEGFDLVDINNTLFWYCEAPNFGVKFLNTSKIEFSSCEFIRWFRESTIPTPANYATCPMIELLAGSYGAMNVSGCVLHPQETQDGIKVNVGVSVVAGATIAANTFVGAGLTTGVKFFPNPATGGYSNTECLNFDITTNQGLPNSQAYLMATLDAFGPLMSVPLVVPIPVDFNANVITENSQRYTMSTEGELTYIGNKSIYGKMIIGLSVDKGGGGTDQYQFYIYKAESISIGSLSTTLSEMLASTTDNTSGVANGTYTLLESTTSGSGTGAVFTIVFSGGNLTGITATTAGSGYLVGDSVVLQGTDMGGTGTVDIVLVYDDFFSNLNNSVTQLSSTNQGQAMTMNYATTFERGDRVKVFIGTAAGASDSIEMEQMQFSIGE